MASARNLTPLTDLLSAVTGWDLKPIELVTTGERGVWRLAKAKRQGSRAWGYVRVSSRSCGFADSMSLLPFWSTSLKSAATSGSYGLSGRTGMSARDVVSAGTITVLTVTWDRLVPLP